MNAMPNGDSQQKPPAYKPPERLSSRVENQNSIVIQPIVPRDGSQKLPSTQPTIFRDSSQKSTSIPATIPYQNGRHRLPSTQLKPNLPYTSIKFSNYIVEIK
jgi:hypothetical protein